MLAKPGATPLIRAAIVAAVVALVSAATSGFAVYSMYHDAITVASLYATDMATILAEDVANTAKGLDLALRDGADIAGSTMARGKIDDETSPQIHRALALRIRALDIAQVVAVADEKGVVVAGSRSDFPIHISIADREYFTALRDDAAKSFVVSKPLANRIDGALSIFFARRIEGDDGRFLGVVFVAVEPSHLFQKHSTMTATGDRTFSLFYADSTVALREPATPSMTGKPMPDAETWLKVAAAGGGVYHSGGVFDPYPKYVAVHRVPGLPFFVNVSVAEAAALKTWRARTWVIASGVAIGLLTVALLVYSQWRLAHRLSRSRMRSWMRARRLSTQACELSATRGRFGLTLDVMSQGMAIFDADDRLVVCNHTYAELYDLRLEDLPPGMTARDIYALRVAVGSYCGQAPQDYMQFIEQPAPRERVDRLRNGRILKLRGRPVAEGGWVTIHEDVTESVRATEDLAFAAAHDALTGLANRNAFKIHLDARLAGDRSDGFAVLVVDIRGFKEVNDAYGHEIGDGALVELAGRLEYVAETALLARLGGDEFAIATAQRCDDAAATDLAERLLAEGQRAMQIAGRFVSLDLSVGVYPVAPEERDASAVMRRVDLALGAAKERGRNTLVLFDDEMERRYVERFQLSHDLRLAASQGQLEVHYQPVYDRAGKRVVCMEALARWRHPTRGLIPPAIFIPLAERAGLIVDIGDWILRRAVADAEKWRPDIVVAVNVSALQVERPDFADKVLAVLAHSDLGARRLQLEITESLLLRADPEIDAVLRQLRAIGVTFALDDFGSGYASLAYLKKFPVDKIKIDKSFIDDICRNPHSIAIVTAIVALSREFAATTTAEGVELAEQFEVLRAMGVDSLQGFYFSKPKPIAAFSVDEIGVVEADAA